jgi:hypothetical protein
MLPHSTSEPNHPSITRTPANTPHPLSLALPSEISSPLRLRDGKLHQLTLTFKHQPR